MSMSTFLLSPDALHQYFPSTSRLLAGYEEVHWDLDVTVAPITGVQEALQSSTSQYSHRLLGSVV